MSHLSLTYISGAAFGMKEIEKTFSLMQFMTHRFIDGGLLPLIQETALLEQEITGAFMDALSGRKSLPEIFQNLHEKTISGLSYDQKVRTLGKELFGSARFDGEKVLKDNGLFKLSVIPPKKGVKVYEGAVFHLGGFLPYSDRIFRFLPEANFFDRFLEAGITVYALELKENFQESGLHRTLTFDRLMETIDEMTDAAFAHHGRKLILEGYCGLAMPALSYLAAFPEKAETKIKAAFTLVAPVDGRQCKTLAQMMHHFPETLLKAHITLSKLAGGTVKGHHLRSGMDIPIKGFFSKTPAGRFFAGFKQSPYAVVNRVEELSSAQRKDLAGAYWISPQNCDAYPMPVELVNFSSSLFLKGVEEDGGIPQLFKGKPLSFRDTLKKTSIKIAGFYGGKDALVPEETGRVLKSVFQDRYTHVVHPQAGHISYVLSPELWDQKHPKALNPNPVTVIKDLYEG